MPRLPPVAMSRHTRLRARFWPGVGISVLTLFQSHSSSSATSWARPVSVPWPISVRAMRMTTSSFGRMNTQAPTSSPSAPAISAPGAAAEPRQMQAERQATASGRPGDQQFASREPANFGDFAAMTRLLWTAVAEKGGARPGPASVLRVAAQSPETMAGGEGRHSFALALARQDRSQREAAARIVARGALLIWRLEVIPDSVGGSLFCDFGLYCTEEIGDGTSYLRAAFWCRRLSPGTAYFRGRSPSCGQARDAVSHVSPLGSSEQRARQLADAVDKTFPYGPVHIIAHSMGGLDGRVLIARNHHGLSSPGRIAR